ncbi:MAG: 30S ribosomal protein S12 methylthiotransferase RimO [Armatimonadota bacterium]|nr:30S ribosomal protein S12 methylthiotransferase RimO [Armatimonadota bacterium]
MAKIGVINLGCPKNRVDAEEILGEADKAGYEVENDPSQADVLIVNTCGFIESAKEESITAVLDAVRWKAEGACRSVIVTGCLAQRYGDDLAKELPDVDAVIGLGRSSEFGEIIKQILEGERVVEVKQPGKWWTIPRCRILSTPPWTAYLRIADGCDNRCSYCAIPDIRGNFASRAEDDILAEAEGLAKLGVKELNLVGQDITKYGLDTSNEFRLAKLVGKLARLNGIRWIRLLYCYPTRITDELIRTIAQNEKVCKYLDVPLQHCSDRILKAMGRQGTGDSYRRLFERIRGVCPEIALRTTFIVGFPGETDEDFEELLAFVQDIKFDRLGAFVYSPEEGTPAASFDKQVDKETANNRLHRLMLLQKEISKEKHQMLVGTTLEVLVEENDGRLAVGRSYRDAPEIDGVVYIENCSGKPGQFIQVEVIEGSEYDLFSRPVKASNRRKHNMEVLN